MNSYILLILFLIIILILILINDDSEGFAAESDQNAEAIQHIAELYNTEQLTLSNVTATETIQGKTIIPTDKISSAERIHLSGTKDIYLSGQGVVIGKESGGNGNLTVEGTIEIGGGMLGSHEDLSIASAGSLSLDSDSVTSSGDFTSKGNTFSNRNKARYINVGNDGSNFYNEYWQVSQLVAYDDAGNNISQGKSVKRNKGSEYKNSKKGMETLTDGNIFKNTAPSDNNDYCYLGESPQQLQIDLGSEQYISQIVLFGRHAKDEIDRMDGTIIELLDSDGKTTRKIHTGIWNRTFSKEYLLN